MKSLLYALIIGASLTSAGTASAQTTAPPAPAQPAAPVTYSTYQACPVSAELNKYEIRRCRELGVITVAVAREIRARKQAATRSENNFLKAQAAQLGRSVVSAGTSGRLGF